MGKIYKALEKADKISKPGNKKTPVQETVSTPASHPANPAEKKTVADIYQVPEITVQDMVTVLKPYSQASEQFRLLKNNILFPENGEPPRTIMVTSPSPNEGKSFITANLAAIIAKSIDEYVLLIDCDLRKPTIQNLFGYTQKEIKGLSDYLSNNIPLSAALKKTAINKLTILPAGQVPPNPSELLSSDQMRRMLHEVKLRYTDRYILIDTPPPYITSETNAIARHVDGIILVVRHGQTRTKEVQDIVDTFGKNKIIGVVKNFSKRPVGYGYGYHKYGYSNYRYPAGKDK